MQDLGKALGTQTIVFNCGDALDADFMSLFLCGVAQCGAFACFDEFNRIDVEVRIDAIRALYLLRSPLLSKLSSRVHLLHACNAALRSLLPLLTLLAQSMVVTGRIRKFTWPVSH